LGKFCVEKAWIADGFPGELDDYIEGKRRDARGPKHAHVPSITVKEEPFISPREILEAYNQDSPSHTKFFVAKLEEVRAQLEECLAKGDYRKAVSIVKRSAKIEPSAFQEQALFSSIDNLVHQREIVNQHHYDEQLEEYRESKQQHRDATPPQSVSHSDRKHSDEEGKASAHLTKRSDESSAPLTERRDESQDNIRRDSFGSELDASRHSDPKVAETKPDLPVLGAIATSEYKEEIADDILDFVQSQKSPLEAVKAAPQTPKPQFTRLSFDDFKGVVLEWYKENEIPSAQEAAKRASLEDKLAETIQEYEQLRNFKVANNEDVSAIDSILKTLRSQVPKKQETPRQVDEGRFWDSCRRNLHEAFVFYAKQQKMLGTKPSFEDISRNLSTLNIGKFVRFFRDFGLMENGALHKGSTTAGRVLDRKTLVKIFMKHSIVQKEMEEEHFLKALDAAAEAYYNRRFDALLESNEANKPLEDKRRMFFRVLEVDNFEAMHPKFKGFGKPFGSNTDNRIPENDLAQRYKYKQYQHQRLSVEEYKKIKAMKVVVSTEPQKVEPVHKAPADAIVSYQNPVNTKVKTAKKGRNPFTWQGLGDMQPEQLKDADDDFDIKDLIVEDSSEEDEYLAKQFPISPRHDEVFITAGK
jgi:hypothetical protein